MTLMKKFMKQKKYAPFVKGISNLELSRGKKYVGNAFQELNS